jgi:hypothetical protein
MQTIYSDVTISMSEFKKNPAAVFKDACIHNSPQGADNLSPSCKNNPVNLSITNW